MHRYKDAGSLLVEFWQEEREGDLPPRQHVELPRFERPIEGLGLYPGS